ncbi:Ubiquitin carboxyl-terminal hydrolase 37 [Stylophora pistillata]|uniref:Ubiquitin carboxyl-terminal hydrolase 37 n=1 Tax=Stylophora pistillata TaxID=50429 RepID=A0A2B4RWV3_STYPI|nr:Ubiquitin carboxyl-terminal hydrolase 37 [Stylophora pistillata]
MMLNLKKFSLKPDKFSLQSRESRLTLSFTERGKSAVSMHLREAEPNQLRTFLDFLNSIKAYNATFKGKLLSSSSKGKDIENAENLPLNNTHSNVSMPRMNYKSPLRRNLLRSSPSGRTNKPTPSVQRNLHAKQMNPPSSNRPPNKTPLVDKTFARDNLSNTSSGGKSVTSFYGSQNLMQSPSNWKSAKNVRGPGLMPAPQTMRLTSQISFRSREKHLYEKDFALTGFSNLGNTCYMNAILQSLLGVPPFVQDLSNRALLENVHPHCLYNAFLPPRVELGRCLHSVLMCKRKCGNLEVLKNCLRKLKRTISEAATRFSGYHQHDAHEFLCQVFDQLKDDVSKSNSPSPKDTSKESNPMLADLQCPVTRSFESGVVHTVICKQCGESVPKEEIYHAFSLDIPVLCSSSDMSPFSSAISMQTLVEKHFEDEQLEYTCGKCESKEAVISHSFSRLPRVLILHLKRYGFDNFTEEQAKRQDKIKIERFINLSMLCSTKSTPPLTFQPKPSLKLSPSKSGRKPQKRHLISEDDDEDFCHFQPSPSVRRKLSHSFSNENFTSAARDTLMNTKNFSDDEMQVLGVSKLDRVTENGRFHDQMDEQIHDSEKTDVKDITKFDGSRNAPLHQSPLRYKSVLGDTEEEQMDWALAESAKSAEKESTAKQETNENDAKCNTSAIVLSNDTTSNISDGYSNLVSCVTDQPTIGDKDVIEVEGVEIKPQYCTPIWEDTEEEQIKWALAESTKSAEKESMAKLNGLEQKPNTDAAECNTETEDLSEDATYNFDSDDFNQLSEISDEDLVFMAQNSKAEGPVGLKGGAPIKMATQDISHDLDNSLNDTGGYKSCGEDSSLETSVDKGFVLKNSTPKICIKKRTSSSVQKRMLQRNFSLSKTPMLGKFEGDLFDDDLFDDGVKESNTPVTNAIGNEVVGKSSWEVQSFSDEDIKKAINMSLQDQTEDEDLKRALQLSLQDFEGRDLRSAKAVSPAAVDPENLTEPTFEDDEGEPKLSTHSYRLISIVSHLGTSSTSGHYISDVYDCKTKQWTSYDDSAATKVAEHSVRYKRQHSGYIFFYLYKQCVDAIDKASPSKENSQR